MPQIGDMDLHAKDPCIDESSQWMNYVDTMKVYDRQNSIGSYANRTLNKQTNN